jgi:hypothetical protein
MHPGAGADQVDAVALSGNVTINALFPDTKIFVAEWTMAGTLGQPMLVGNRIVIPDGRLVKFDGLDACPVREGRITLKNSYVDATAG